MQCTSKVHYIDSLTKTYCYCRREQVAKEFLKDIIELQEEARYIKASKSSPVVVN